MQEFSIPFSQAPLDLPALLLNLLVGVILSLLISWHFKRFGSTLSNRAEFSQVFPFVLLTTVLIITIVKSSLALSLGLVGALSIVRFRTPIKEPEELAYLFLAIACGLGLGANQTMATIIASVGILLVMAVISKVQPRGKQRSLFLSIDLPLQESEQAKVHVDKVNKILESHLAERDLRRLDVHSGSIEFSYIVGMKSQNDLSAVVDELVGTYPEAGVTFLDQNNIPSV